LKSPIQVKTRSQPYLYFLHGYRCLPCPCKVRSRRR
jgi:hypothetical protein